MCDCLKLNLGSFCHLMMNDWADLDSGRRSLFWKVAVNRGVNCGVFCRWRGRENSAVAGEKRRLSRHVAVACLLSRVGSPRLWGASARCDPLKSFDSIGQQRSLSSSAIAAAG